MSLKGQGTSSTCPSLVQLLLLKWRLTGVLYFPVSLPEGGSLQLETQFMS